MSLWLKWQAQFLAAGQPNFSLAKNMALAEIKGNLQQSDTKELQDFLNNLYKSISQTEVMGKLADKIDSSIQHVESIEEYRKMTNGLAQIGGGLTVKSVQGNAYYSALRAFESGNASMDTFRSKSDLARDTLQSLLNWQQGLEGISPQEVRAKAASEFGRIASIQGKMLEQFLAMLGTAVAQVENEVADDYVEKIANSLAGTVDNFIPQTVEGDKSTTVSVIIGDNTDNVVKIIGGAKDKIDINMRLPFLDNEKLASTNIGISAKNMSKFRDIKLLSGGNVVNLISQSFAGAGGKWLYNAFMIPSYTGLSGLMNEINKVFLIKAMTGQHGAEETKANVMVLYIGDRVNPFRVISTSAVLSDIITMDETDLAKYVKFEYSPGPPPINAGIPRTEESLGMVNSMTLNVTLTKEAIKLSYLKQLG